MLPAFVKLTAYRGDSWRQEFRLLQSDTPLDLSGSTVKAWASLNGSQPVVLDVEIGPDPGVVVLSAAPDELPVGELRYDVEVTTGEQVTTWVRGLLAVTQDVTNYSGATT